MIRRAFINTALVLIVAFICSGCASSGPEIAYVTGKVTMDGKPLSHATVLFVPENGRPAGATTDKDGNYVLNFSEGRKGAIPGASIVRIMTFRDADQDENGQTIPGSPETVPSQYNTESTLTFDVQPKKKNVANFELKSEGRLASRDI